MATIAMVLEAEYPPDIRVEKEASALAAAGHDIHLLALDLSGRALGPRHGTVTVHRVRVPRRLHKKLHPTLVRWPVYREAWRRWIVRFVERVRPDVLTVHDLPLAAPALAAAGTRLPVVLDLHENFPAAIESWGFDRGLLGAHLYDLERWRAYERAAVRRAAGVVVVVEEARRRLDDYGVSRERTAVVMNTERPDFGENAPRTDAGGGPPLKLLYIGGFGPHRGIDTAIRAVAELDGRLDVELRLVGDGRIRGELEALIRTLGLDARVQLERWVPAEAVPGEIGACHVGLVPHVRSAHTETTIPHKLFQYMLLGRPVLVSDCAPLARITADAGAGLVFRSGDAADMARAIAALSDPEPRRTFGESGRRAAAGRLSWSETARTLVDFYARILADRRQ